MKNLYIKLFMIGFDCYGELNSKLFKFFCSYVNLHLIKHKELKKENTVMVVGVTHRFRYFFS